MHLCLGDLGHHALKQLKDASPLVVLANAIARRWPEGRSLDYVHLLMSGGDIPPTTVDIATSCALGRRTPDAATAAVASMRALLDL